LKQIKRLNSYLLLSGLTLVSAGPFFWLITTSLSGSGNIFAFPPPLFPTHITIRYYTEVWKTVPMGRFFLNTLWIVSWGTFLTVLFSAMAGYPLARMEFKGRNLIFFLLLATLMLPDEALLLVNFLTCAKLGLTNTYLGVFLPSAASVFGIFLMRQAFLSIPKELEDAAIMDGCSAFTLWWKILLPIVAPSLATLAVFAFVGYWNSFLWPLIILTNTKMYPLSVGLTWLSGTFSTNFRIVAAGAVLAMLPTLIIFLALQKYFIRGITSGMGK
jgi:putative chitobiose transport system permease protein